MTKKLEALKRIDERNYLTEREHREFYNIVEKALQRLEAIENAKPNGALECLDKTEDNIVERNVDCLLHNIENGHFIKCDVCDVNWHKGCMCCVEHLKNSEEINTIKQALIKAEQNQKIIDELKTLVKYEKFGKQKNISLAVLRNALKEVL